MLISLKLKLLGPNGFPPNILDAGRSRLRPQGGGSGGGCIAARGDDISIMRIAARGNWTQAWYGESFQQSVG
jgi:hypothetical protein